MTGSQLVDALEPLSVEDREEAIYREVASGNVPEFYRTPVTITVSATINDAPHEAVYRVCPEYLALGSDNDPFLMPTTPTLAQRIADLMGACLPTRRMVDQIWSRAPVKLSPSPIPPSPAMTTIPVFWDHNTTVAAQRRPTLGDHPLGSLVGGHKKDVVVTPQLADLPDRVAIYGWHYQDGTPIQNLYLGHAGFYADYSHGIRLVGKSMTVDGRSTTVGEVLADPALAALLSDEGPFENARYRLPADAVASNLVVNGSFEAEFAGGTPAGWHLFSATGSPGFGRASINKRDGDHSQYWGRGDTVAFDAGVYHQVTVEPGARYEVIAWLKRQSRLPSTRLRFGIDPAGGTSPEAASIEWTDRTGGGNNVWLPCRAAVTAQGDALTLFARGGHSAGDDATNAFFYCDSVSVTLAGEDDGVETSWTLY